MTLYLDYNASTPVDGRVLEEMVSVYRERYGNASSRTHVVGERAQEAVQMARTRVAALLSVAAQEVIFTSGATESDNLAILGLARWGLEHSRRHIISTAIEHKAVLEPLRHLAQQGMIVELVRPDASGRVRAEDVLARVKPDTLLVSVMHANNETGIIQPVTEIGQALAGSAVFFHIDAAQTFGKLVAELRETPYDLLSISGHKIYGPQGIGALVLRRRGYEIPPVQPIAWGGEQEGGLRPGTLPTALIAGLGKAAELAMKEHCAWQARYIQIRKQILSQVQRVPHAVNGAPDFCLANTLNVSFYRVNAEALMLAIRGSCAVSNGSACTSHRYEPSHVLTAMGLEPERVASAIRLSWGHTQSTVDLSALIETVASIQ